jgi:hypothetical protein
MKIVEHKGFAHGVRDNEAVDINCFECVPQTGDTEEAPSA